MTKSCCLVTLISVVNKFFEKLVNNILVDHLEICCLFLFPIWFHLFSCNLLTIVPGKIARTSDRSWASQTALAHDISKAFDRVWQTGLLQKLVPYRSFSLISSFLSNKRLTWFGWYVFVKITR